MAKPRVIFREWKEKNEGLSSFIDIPRYIPEYDAHLLKSIGLKGEGIFELVYNGTRNPDGEALSPFAYLQLIVDDREDGIYKVDSMSYQNRYNNFLEKLEKIERDEEKRPKYFLLGCVISGRPTFYDRVTKLALKCFGGGVLRRFEEDRQLPIS
jgi:hypothetical protein